MTVNINLPPGPALPPSTPPPGQTKPLPAPTSTGKIPFTIPNTDLKAETWYSIYGTLTPDSIPLICLHGGPGMAHNYLLPCAHISASTPVILYDQVGCGKSTHFPERKHDVDFWTIKLFQDELLNLTSHLKITQYDILGQSWGGMLGAEFATTHPSGLRKLIIADSPADMKTWVEVADELRKRLPEDVQETLTRLEKENKTETKEYEKAMTVFYERYVCRVVPFPKELNETLEQVMEDNTVYLTMNGPSEFFVSGSLKNWDITPSLHKITVPVLLINGRFDEAQDITMEPYFKEIQKAKWVRFAESGHCPHLEETDAFVEAVTRFLAE